MTNKGDVSAIRSWLSKQPHLPKDVDDHLIQRFLHVCGRSLERTKTVMDLFFVLRAEAPEFFRERDPLQPCIKAMLQVIDLVPLPILTPEGYKCFLYRLTNADPEGFFFNDCLKAFFIVGDARIHTETTFPAGEVIIFDMDKFTFRHLTKLILPSLRKYMQYTQEAHPVRLKQIHVLNVSPILDKVMILIKPLMKSEVAQMLHFHVPNSTTLQDYIPIDVLPEDYGGKAGSVTDLKDKWWKIIVDNRDWFLTEPWLADLSKRVTNQQSVIGMNGSFRNLAID